MAFQTCCKQWLHTKYLHHINKSYSIPINFVHLKHFKTNSLTFLIENCARLKNSSHCRSITQKAGTGSRMCVTFSPIPFLRATNRNYSALCDSRGPCIVFFSRLALYVYEYLLHVGAQKAAQTFLSEVSVRVH
jgi:hypothetical protein